MSGNDYVRKYEGLKSARVSWDSHWQEVSQYAYPEADGFYSNASNSTKGGKKTQQIFDATAPHALTQFASLMESLLTPRQGKWHSLQTEDMSLRNNREVQEWFEEVSRRLFAKRYAPKANFQGQMNEVYMSLGSFGTGAIYIDYEEGQGMRYKSCFIGDIYIDVNFQGVVDTVYRRFDYSNQQAVQRWGANAPTRVLNDIEKKPYERKEYLHVVVPNTERDLARKDHVGMPYLEHYISLEEKEIITTGGYRTMPYAVSRYLTSPHEIYGRSPMMAVLPDIRTLNEMAKTDLRASQKLVDPPLLVYDDGVLGAGGGAIDLRCGGLNMGGVNSDGRAMVQPLTTGARVDINEQKMEVKRTVIKQALLVDLFQILVQTPRMSATEAMLRSQEKGALLAPIMGRQQSELLGVIVERELDILLNNGMLPEVPQALVEAADIDVIYDSPLSRMQRSEELIGIQRTIEMATATAPFDDGEALRMLDTRAILDYVREGNGAPVGIIKTDEQIAADTQQRNEQQQQQQQGQQQADGARSLKDLAQAQQALSGAANG